MGKKTFIVKTVWVLFISISCNVDVDSGTTLRSGTVSDDNVAEPLTEKAKEYEPALKFSNQLIELIKGEELDKVYDQYFDEELKSRGSKEEFKKMVQSNQDAIGRIESFNHMQWKFRNVNNSGRNMVESTKIVEHEKAKVNYIFIFIRGKYDKIVGIHFRKINR